MINTVKSSFRKKTTGNQDTKVRKKCGQILHFQAHQPSQDTYKNNDFPVRRINVNYTSIIVYDKSWLIS
jgi:hypothetical protein